MKNIDVEVNKRIKIIRKYYNLSQEKFGERIGVQKSQISRIETGKNSATSQVCLSVCREFNINQDWLKYGKDEMLASDSVDELISNYHLDAFGASLVREYLRLSDDHRRTVEDFFYNVAKNISV